MHIETGRHRRPCRTPVNERFCESCDPGDIGDELHTIISSDKFKIHSENFFKTINGIYPEFTNLNNENKFKFIMGSDDVDIIKKKIFCT